MTIRDSIQQQHSSAERNLDLIPEYGYQVQVCHEAENTEWDAFLSRTPGGHHVQTSLWAQVQSLLGWYAVRIVVRQGGQIVAGAQALIRALSHIGTIGHVTKGPIFALDDPALTKLVMDELFKLIKTHRLQYFILQPPYNGEAFARQLPDRGFRPSPIEFVHTATVLLDLIRDPDEILAQMNSKTRYNIRLGERKGITVREGTANDLSTFYRLLVATGKRQDFSTCSEEYFSFMWDIFAPHGYIKLFLAEYQGEVVSAFLDIPFGDTVLYKRGAWSGVHGNRHPNEVLHWTGIRWAKSQGYRYYDLEGIHPEAARAVLQGEPLPDSTTKTVTTFKLGFGGQVVLLPEIYDYVYNPLLRWSYNAVFPKISDWRVVQGMLQYLRTH